ncbi:MAG: DUF1080 domain-containing protein [Bacteroidota bacterium]
MRILKAQICIVLLLVLGSQYAFAQKDFKTPSKKVKSKDWISLLDEDLSQWEVWTGVPEPSVKNLPSDYQRSKEGKNENPIGLGDPMGIFKVTGQDKGELVLNISGEIYAGLTSKKEYANYHLTLLFKWGEKKYEPRLERKRDNGLLYHCHGEHGAFWNVWKSSLEFQIQEGDFGDLFKLAGTQARVTVDNQGVWDPNSQKNNQGVRTIRGMDAESPNGQWTRVDLYVLQDSSIHLTNGKVVMALTNAKSKKGKKLTKGQLQIQSEGAECFIKDVCIRSIDGFPDSIKKLAGL